MRRALAAVPVLVWLAVALFLTTSLAQTLVLPNGRSPDERQHVDLVVKAATGQAWPWPDPGTATIATGSGASQFLPSNRLDGPQHLPLVDVPARGERASYLDAGGAEPWASVRADGVTRAVRNQLVQHPPLYYLAGGALLNLWPDWQHAPFDQVWLTLRWANALLLAPLPLLVWAVARRLRLPAPLPVAAALVPFAVPELTRLAASVNNDNLLVLLFAVVTVLLARVVTGDASRRTGVLLGVLTTAALLTKGFALLLPAWIALAYAVLWWRSRTRAPVVALGLAAACAVPGALWWVRNLVLFGRVQPAGNRVHQVSPEPLYSWSDGGWHWLGRLLDRFVTTFAVQDGSARLARDASWWGAHVLLVLVLAGLALTLARGALRRADVAVLVLPTVALGGIVAAGSWETFTTVHTMAAMQGRYLYGGLAGMAVAALAAAGALAPRRRRFVSLGVLGVALVVHAAYQVDVWQLYWTAPGRSLADAARAASHLYPFGTGVQAIVLTAAAAALVTCVVATVRAASAAAPDDVEIRVRRRGA
ncbi:glycosyltransferase family 39 protein [Xylanimonas protaetiae]|uniref:Glycosyltransferase RgtA/B/C/D-like domain-containing protein n=1 Tax=Xylanimonas protaetiae TaxID=2509457 RepID=A0A4P6F103_9MICO|nr:glycosyltransferase family 39 protein [Xylanimonas protaetiae]QAY68886.1 hypothetical protein ET471_01525 [Xylanimonas protaetiae]